MRPTVRLRKVTTSWAGIAATGIVFALGAPLAASVLIATSASATASSAPAAAAPRASTPVIPSCAWPIITNPERVNVAYPDTSATYWTTPYRVEPNTKLIVNGQYPNARFMSFNAYDSTGGAFSVGGVPGALIDYQINPKLGSLNPWQHHRTRGDISYGVGGKFRVTLASNPLALGARSSSTPNVMPMAPTGTAAGSIGFLLMRVYLPKNGDFSAVKLPSISAVTEAGTKTIKPCAAKAQKSPTQALKNLPAGSAAALKKLVAKVAAGGNTDAGPGPCEGSACPPMLQFARASAATTNSVFPNSASAYVSALFQPNPKRVVLVRARAPRTPALVAPGTQPLPWPSPRFQLQYFSLCNNIYRKPWPVIINKLPGGGQDLGCRADNATKLDRAGRYTYVVAEQSRQQAVSRWPNTTFVPTSIKSGSTREVLIFRNMLSNSNFHQSAMNAPQNMSPADAAAAMGPYYPRATSCPINFYLKNGPTACFNR